ncbi:protein ROS1A-like isoform X2 [Dioscorea cayenensis subsp. rotundata]|uniref:Protein ROS1A-like isoform X2 n=1 Tax=Dioscorea cayennensis subsp. rotundata TaxID=55577 RepID=A0AB40ASV6_DIOCR|nr:protein ROS1A-like isoform X2 [Dioscorea cayenensis subsp. rotundata]
MDMHEEQNLQNSDEVSNTDNTVEQHATTSKKKIQHKRPRLKKITSKIRKNDGPPLALDPLTPDLVTPKPARKRAKICKRKNGRKRKNGNNFVSETMQPWDSSLENTDAQNKDGKFSVRRKLNLNEESKFSSEDLLTHLRRNMSFSFLHKVYKRRRIDNMKSQNLYRHPAFSFTPFCKGVEEKRCLIMSLSKSQMLKQQQNAVNGTSDGLCIPSQIDLNKTSSADCSKNSAEYLSASMNFSLFTKFYKRRKIEKEKSFPAMFTRHQMLMFASEHRLITPAILTMLNSTLETSRAELTKKKLEIPVPAFDLDKLESNDVCNQLMAISTPVKSTQKPRKQRESLADVQSALKHQELALVPYVHPLNSLEQKPDTNVNRNRWKKSMTNWQNAFVPYDEATAMVPYKRQPNRDRLVVAFDPRNRWLWNCFASKEHIPDTDTGAFSDDTKRWWENERRVFQGRAESFLAKIRLIQGNRRFSKWKGSVVDSVVGVFLTQNVSDLLSSSSFMNLIARFPPKSKENVHGPDSVKITSLVEKRILTMDEKSKCDEAIDETNEDENSLRNSVGSPISPCKNCTESSICSEIEDLIGNRSCCRNPSKGLVTVGTQPDEIFSKKKEPKSYDSILQNLKVLKVSKSHSKGIVQNKPNNNPNTTPKAKKLKTNEIASNNIDWDNLRKEAYGNLPTKERNIEHIDSADWEAVSQADVDVIADAIRLRGQHNVLAARVKNFLIRMAKDHGSIDLEWLRNVSPDKAKEYLRSIEGLGLKSVDCVRLLGLHFKAFPVDTNIARIFVRLGWIPLQPLPESAQLHAIDKYPIMGTVQEYLWPRLWTLDQPTLYELHYQLITFGKVFCTKKNPNCNACPMRNECKHFASAYASAKRLLTGPEERSSVNSIYSSISSIDSFTGSRPLAIAQLEDSQLSEKFNSISCEPVIEEPPSPQHEPEPKTEHIEQYCANYSDGCLCNSDEDDIIEFNLKDASQDFKHINEANSIEPQDDGNSNLALIVAPFVSFLMPALKSTHKFRTKHYVYELPGNHPLLEGMDEQEENDEYRYLFAIWKPGENAESSEPPINHCSFQGFDELCNNMACFRCNGLREAKSETVRGTLLIPCRTAMRGRFPLNGTYFQVNEVFADNKSSKDPIVVPRNWLWNLPRKICYFGTGISTIFRGLTMEEIQFCMGQGTVCIRGFDRETRRVELLYKRLHVPASQAAKKKMTPKKEHR